MLTKNPTIGFNAIRLSKNQLLRFSTQADPKIENRDEG